MRLVGYRTTTGTAIGRRDGDTKLVPLGDVEQFWADPAHAVQQSLGTLLDLNDLTLVPPVPPTARVLCVGLNYAEHVAEGTFKAPVTPSRFGRWTRSLTVSGTPAPVPAGEPGLDWEGELVAVVGQQSKHISAANAGSAVFGYAAFNDLTARGVQHRTTQWTVGKNADQSGPMSEIVTADEVGDPAAGLRIMTRVNGEVMQDGTTADMIFSVGEILAYLSETMTLYPGDLIVTGTPNGVGYTRRPPRFLHPGDEVTVDIERVGSVRTPIIAGERLMMSRLHRFTDAVAFQPKGHAGVNPVRLTGMTADESLNVVVSTYEPGAHAERSPVAVDTVYVLLTGQLTITIDDEPIELHYLDSLVLAAGCVRAVDNSTDEPASMFVIRPNT